MLRDLRVLLRDGFVHTFEAELRDWVRPRPSNVLVVSRTNGPEVGGVRWSGAGPFPKASVTHRRLWFEEPDRLRVEVFRGNELVRLCIRDRETWWRWGRINGADTGTVTRDGRLPTVPPLLDPPLLSPSRLLRALRFEPMGSGQRLGYDVLLARAWPRGVPGRTAEVTFEFEFDAKHGTVLQHTRFEHGVCVQVTEALSARFDTPIDPSRFEFAAPL